MSQYSDDKLLVDAAAAADTTESTATYTVQYASKQAEHPQLLDMLTRIYFAYEPLVRALNFSDIAHKETELFREWEKNLEYG